MTWKAKHDIAEFKKGEVVPDDRAALWNEMYDISPVEFEEGTITVSVEPLIPADEEPVIDDAAEAPSIDDADEEPLPQQKGKGNKGAKK